MIIPTVLGEPDDFTLEWMSQPAEWVGFDSSSYNLILCTARGHSKKMQIQPSTGARRNFFENRVCKIWNNLSEKTVSSKNVDIFKNNLFNDIGNTRFNFVFSY